MEVVVQSPNAAHSGKYGLLIKVTKAFDYDWHAQVSMKAFTPPDTNHGYVFSFWGRASASHGAASMRPKVVFQDKDDEYTPLKQVTVPLEADWNMYQVDLSIPKYRRNHAIVINFWLGEAVGSFSFDDLQASAAPITCSRSARCPPRCRICKVTSKCCACGRSILCTSLSRRRHRRRCTSDGLLPPPVSSPCSDLKAQTRE